MGSQVKTLFVTAIIAILAVGCGGESDNSLSLQEPWCGNGMCEFGEFCSVCPDDCDCKTLAATPPMGWNSWNRFGCDIDEAMCRETADAMVESGMRDAGYVYLNLDDCWQTDRSRDGTIIADPERFPSGIPALADYVHSRGLKFGLYTCAGTETCQERPGSAGYEEIDARTYAEWEVDYVKVDWCNTEGMDARTQYGIMRDALAASGRPMVFSICNWGYFQPHIWGPYTGHLWRTTGDIADSFVRMLYNFYITQSLPSFAGPGHWNDPDMLEVGNGGMSAEEYRTHFSLWAILAAPLIAGNDLREMSGETRDILLNREVIAVDQDPLGIPGLRVSGSLTGVWARPLAREGARAVVLFNGLWFPAQVKVRWSDVGLAEGEAQVRDLWQHRELGPYDQGYGAQLQPHQSVMLLVTGKEHAPCSGTTYLSDYPWMYAANGEGVVYRDLNTTGHPITLGERAYHKGLGVLASSVILYHLGGRCTSFAADIGIDDEVGEAGTVVFQVLADNELVYDSGLMTGSMEPRSIRVPLDGVHLLKLMVANTGDSLYGDHADWADTTITCQ